MSHPAAARPLRDPACPPGTLLVGTYSSACNNCWRGASTESKTHERAISYGYDEPGCGIEFTHIKSTYVGEQMAKATRDLRPDLEFIETKAGGL